MTKPKTFSGLVLCRLDDFDERGRLKPGYCDADGCWNRTPDAPQKEQTA